MQVLSKTISAWMAVAALGTVGLFAQAQTPAPARHFHHRGQLAQALNLTDAQKSQIKPIFQQARQTAQPIRAQLKQTRQSLQAAVKAGDSNQIQQLAATEGTEIGQLAAIRASARAQMYKILTPDQQQKLSTIQAAHHFRRAPAGNAVQN